MPRLEIFFKNKLQRTISGWTPGGAVFPFELVLKVDVKQNSLQVVPNMIKEKNGFYRLEFKSTTIWMSTNIVLKIERR